MIGYYYCSFETFCSLLKSKNLWLTDLTKSNDSEEVSRLYYNIWEDLKERLLQSDLEKETVNFVVNQFDKLIAPQMYCDIPFGCCMSYENDLVQQWEEYGDNGKGVSIAFDLDWFGIKKQYPSTASLISVAIGYEFVIYDSHELRTNMYNAIYESIEVFGREAYIQRILPTFKHYAGFIKNPAFKDEKEIRILYYPYENFKDVLPGISDLKINVKEHYCLEWANEFSNAMRAITIGYNCQYSEKDIIRMVDNANLAFNQFDGIEVRTSICSYQDRIL